MSAGQASWRPRSGRHNVWEIVVHSAYWKYAAWRRLAGERRGSFPLKGSNWFPRPQQTDEQMWRADIALLDQMHRLLRESVNNLDASDLSLIARGSKVTNAFIVSGVAAHDLYHAGQIQLLKTLGARSDCVN